MKLLLDSPPGFDGITKAFAMAREVPTTHRLGVKVGLARDGKLLATGELDGYRQITLFAEHMREMGYREHLLGGDEDMFGCDMLFSLPGTGPSPVDSDPSFIRKPSIELWPLAAG